MPSEKSGPVCEVPLFKVEGLSYNIGDLPILRDIGFEICDVANHGQVVSILGPSGVGKSTLVKIMTGEIDEGYTGEISVYDDVTKTAIPIRQGLVGMVTQDYYFFPFYTVMKNLTLAAAMKNNSSEADQKARVEDMLHRFGMWEQRHKYRGQISGGEKQRVAIMQQMLCSEHFIVLDEPFTSLDPLKKDALAGLIREVADLDELNTMVVVTHDYVQALVCSDTLILIGRDYENGVPTPGGSIKKVYDLVAMGLAYQENVMDHPEFWKIAAQVHTEYRQL